MLKELLGTNVAQHLSYLLELGTVLVLCLLGLFAVADRLNLDQKMTNLLLFAYTLRIGTAIFVDNLGATFGQVDFFGFDRALWSTAKQFQNGIVTAPYETAMSLGDLFYIPYTAVYAPVYAVFGHHTLFARIAFAFVGTLVVLNIYRIGKLLHGKAVGFYAAGLAAVFPYWLYLSVIFYRDMLIILFLSHMLYLTLRWEQSKEFTDICVVALLSIISFILRPENILPLGVTIGLVCYIIIQHLNLLLKLAMSTSVGLAVFRGVQWAGVNGNAIAAEALSRERQQLADGGGAYLGDIVFNDFGSVLAFAPVGATYFLLVPFPWQIHNFLALVAFFQNIVIWYPVLILSVLGGVYSAASRPIQTLILAGFALSGIAGYGIVEANMGPALRHRSQFQFVLFVFAAIPLAERVQIILSHKTSRQEAPL